MKKNEKYVAVNNQEDEDGYNLYPRYIINNSSIKEKQIAKAHPETPSQQTDASIPKFHNPAKSASTKAAGHNKR